jgi:tetratricopeptide (TPR) repeat protein
MRLNDSNTVSPRVRKRRLLGLLGLLLLLGLLAVVINADALQRWRYRDVSAGELLVAARTHPDDLLLAEIAGERLLEADRALEAKDLLLPVAERHSRSVELTLLAGRAAWKSGNEAQGGALLRQAVELAPTNAEARFWSAEFLRSRGYSHEALDLYGEVIRLNPQHGRAWCRVGEIELEDEHAEKALDALNRAEQFQPSADTAYHRAVALHALGRVPEAEQSARVAYQRRRTSETAALLGKMVQLAPGPKPMREAQGYFRQAVELNPQAIETLKLLAINQRSLGEHAAAVRTLRQMLRTAPAMADGYLLLAQSYQALGKRTQGDQVLHTYRMLEPLETAVSRAEYQSNIAKGSVPGQLGLARAYVKVGRQDLARNVLERILRKSPGHPEATALLRKAQAPPSLQIPPLPVDPEGDAP